LKKVVIVGGGIAGLSAGIFAQKNGFESIILEKNSNLGGECTGWDRQGYHIDGCIHWLVGTKEGTGIHDLWTTVGALDGVELFHPESFLTFEHGGVMVHLYRDLERLKSSWLELSPQDEDAIQDFCQAIEKLQSFEIPVGKPMDLMTLVEKIRLMSSMKDAGMIMRKYGKISLKEYARTFKHPALREALATFVPEGYSASSIFFALAAFTKGQASVPYGALRRLQCVWWGVTSPWVGPSKLRVKLLSWALITTKFIASSVTTVKPLKPIILLRPATHMCFMSGC